MAVSLIFLMASKIFYGKYAKIPQSLCPDWSDYGQPALFPFMCFCLFSVTRKKKKKKKSYSPTVVRAVLSLLFIGPG